MISDWKCLFRMLFIFDANAIWSIEKITRDANAQPIELWHTIFHFDVALVTHLSLIIWKMHQFCTMKGHFHPCVLWTKTEKKSFFSGSEKKRFIASKSFILNEWNNGKYIFTLRQSAFHLCILIIAIIEFHVGRMSMISALASVTAVEAQILDCSFWIMICGSMRSSDTESKQKPIDDLSAVEHEILFISHQNKTKSLQTAWK